MQADGEKTPGASWEDLRHLDAFARARSLSGAAARLSVDHATVARRIRALEASLGLKLLDRRAKVPRLTPEGERIAERAARMDAEASSVARVARGLSPRVAGEVSVSAPPTVASALIAPRLGELTARHPELTLRLLGEKRVVSLGRGEADVALRLTRPAEAGLVTRKIGSFGFSLYASPGYLAGRKARDFGFISFDRDVPELPQERWLTRVRRERPVVLRTNDLESQASAARASLGVAALPDFFAARFDDLTPVPVREKPVRREVWLAVHEDLRASKAIRAVIEFVSAAVAGAGGEVLPR